MLLAASSSQVTKKGELLFLPPPVGVSVFCLHRWSPAQQSNRALEERPVLARRWEAPESLLHLPAGDRGILGKVIVFL